MYGGIIMLNKYLDVAPVFARAIEHIHGGTSIADLF